MDEITQVTAAAALTWPTRRSAKQVRRRGRVKTHLSTGLKGPLTQVEAGRGVEAEDGGSGNKEKGWR